ncbi:MAG: DNA ligase [Zoogloeaceae bacterium]|jgi:DNA ligase-1|nr:DNA ligase [Zoogloeaceae bacterium]
MMRDKSICSNHIRSRRRSWLTACVAWVVALCAILPASADEAPPLLLAETIDRDTVVSSYLVSEKLDGVRAFWDGQRLRSRGGKTFNAPRWFVEKFPARSLDGELWAGRGRFERLSGIVRKEYPVDAEWREVCYMIFELPGASGDFRERARLLRQVADEASVPWLQAVEQTEVKDRQALEQKLADVLRAGGEGLMLHRADAPYSTGRNGDLLKMKPIQDAEARVVGHVPGKGKYQGMLGALRVRTGDGVEFSLGAGISDALRRDPPPVGTIITYRYRGLTRRGLPRFASYYRVRDN